MLVLTSEVMSKMRKARATSLKEPASRKASGMAHLLSALHQNAAAVVNSKSQLNGPDQVGLIFVDMCVYTSMGEVVTCDGFV